MEYAVSIITVVRPLFCGPTTCLFYIPKAKAMGYAKLLSLAQVLAQRDLCLLFLQSLTAFLLLAQALACAF